MWARTSGLLCTGCAEAVGLGLATGTLAEEVRWTGVVVLRCAGVRATVVRATGVRGTVVRRTGASTRGAAGINSRSPSAVWPDGRRLAAMMLLAKRRSACR